MATATAKPRKQLSEQLDRLDGIIDLLADALPAAVADATRAGTRQALAELLADPEVLAALKSALAPKEPIGVTTPIRSPERGVMNIAKAGLRAIAGYAKGIAVRAVARSKAAIIRNFRVEVPVLKYSAAAVAIGTLAAGVSYAVPQEFAAALCGLGAAATAAAFLVGARIRRSIRTRAYTPTR